jgi:hypothetical protein
LADEPETPLKESPENAELSAFPILKVRYSSVGRRKEPLPTLNHPLLTPPGRFFVLLSVVGDLEGRRCTAGVDREYLGVIGWEDFRIFTRYQKLPLPF